MNEEVLDEVSRREETEWKEFLKSLESRGLQDEDDGMEMKIDDLEQYPRNSFLKAIELDVTHQVEKVLKSNLKQLFYERVKGQLFYSAEEFNKLNADSDQETKRILKHISKKQLQSYMKHCTKIDKRIPKKIEEKFGTIFKSRLLSRRLIKEEKRYNLTLLLQQWNEISETFSEEEVRQYCFLVFQNSFFD